MSGSLTGNPLMSGGGVDSSIPLKAGAGIPAPINPLASAGQFADTLGKFNQLKLFPGQLTLQQQAITGGGASLAQHLNQVGANAMVPFLSEGAPTMAQLTNLAGHVEHFAGGSTQGIMSQVAAIPDAPDSPEWGRKVKAIIASQAQTNPAESVAQVAGTPVDLQAGGSIISGNRAPVTAGGGITPTSATRVSMTPGEAGQPVQWTDKAGATHYGTKAQYNTALGNGEVNSPAVVTPIGPGGAAFGGSNGRYQSTPTSPGNPALRNPANAPAAGAGFAPLTPNPAAPGMTAAPGQAPSFAGPGTAQSADMQATGANAASRFANISDEGLQARDQTAVLANMKNDLAQFNPGPGADWSLFAKKIISAAYPNKMFGSQTRAFDQSITAQESFRKLMNQLADAQGAGSDARLHVNQGANPSDTLSPGSANFIISQLQGNSDYKLARARLARQYPDQSDVRGFENDIGAKLDPRYFQYNRLTPEQKSDYLAGITNPDERAAFKRGYGVANKAGYLRFDSGGQ